MDTALIITVTLFLVGLVLLALAMLGVTLRFGPRRGTWNQPAAALVRPGRGMFVVMYAVAVLHVACGLLLAATAPGGVGLLIVLVAMATFYVLCAHSFALASAVTRRRRAGH